MNRKAYAMFVLLAAILLLGSGAFAQDNRGEGNINPAQPRGISADEIIRKFAAKEKEFKEARDQYTYRQTVKVQTIDGDTPDGEYQQVTDITYDDKGRRIENVAFAPQSTLQRVSMTREDFDDIEKRLPFVLTSDDIGDYNLIYVGQEQIDELGTYVFDVAPKRIDKGKRYFQGRIWVDDRDYQIVKTQGRNVPDQHGKQENLSPAFTTWREQIDGKYWFPTYTRADDVLKFRNGDVHIREIVKYTNYKRFGSKSKIIFSGQEIERDDQGNPTTPNPPAKPSNPR